jgi:Ca2+-transporting ATPase
MRPSHDAVRAVRPKATRPAHPPADAAPAVPRSWALEAEVVVGALGTDAVIGLTVEEARARVLRFGPNELVERPRRPTWRILLDQFTNAMIIVLLAAALITLAIGDLKDTIVILAIVVLNGVIGFVQEYRAEQAMAALKRLTSPVARVVRAGQVMTVPATDLVPGDLVRLEAGDMVTADLRLVEAVALRVNEAALTGESEPAEKSIAALPGVTAAVIADQRNIAFSGTAVTYGRGQGFVVATGMATALGRVAELLQEHAGGQTPLQRRLANLGMWLAVAAVAVCSIVFVAGIARGEAPETMFLTSVSLAVAAIPEGLPAVVTVALALGARRMAHRHALVRKLPAVETLGSVSVICSDKTGTLTENRMLVERVWTATREYRVAGAGYAPAGRIDPEPADDPDIDALVRVAAACNDSTLHAPAHVGAEWTITGDPTEAALVALAGKLGVSQRSIVEAWPRVEELTFDPERRRMATLHRRRDGIWVAVKGALEAIGPLLAADQSGRLRAAEDVAERYAADGYRVLAIAERTIPAVPDRLETSETDLRLLGLVAMTDPPRVESATAIEACRAAGIRPVMITGDHPLTARAIARRLRILDDPARALTGDELAELDDEAYAETVADVAVYARTSPEQKLRIVEAWQKRGAVVAMTGDGVNDAPALRLSDIGVAMGVMGTEVSKEAADMVLADDNFATIVAAVEEGRRIYDNIRRFVRYLLTTNSAEVLVMFLAPFLGLPLPLIAVQILWINLVTDGLPALALGVEPAERGAMRRPPRPRSESILAAGLWQQAIWVGMLMAGVTLLVQAGALSLGWAWQSMVFTTLALLQLGNALAVRSEQESAFRLGVRANPYLIAAVVGTALVQVALLYVPFFQELFETEALSAPELAVVIVVSSAAFAAVELDKAARRRLSARAGGGSARSVGGSAEMDSSRGRS